MYKCFSCCVIFKNRYFHKIKHGLLFSLLAIVLICFGLFLDLQNIQTSVFSIELYKWLYFFASLIIGYFCGQIIDKIMFMIFYGILYIISFINTTHIYYYASSFEVNIGLFVADIIIMNNYQKITNDLPSIMDNVYTFLLFIFVGNILTNIILKIIQYNRLFTAYQKKIDMILLYKQIVTRLSKFENTSIDFSQTLNESLVTKLVHAKESGFKAFDEIEIVSKKKMEHIVDKLWNELAKKRQHIIIDMTNMDDILPKILDDPTNKLSSTNIRQFVPVSEFIDKINFKDTDTNDMIKLLFDQDNDTYVKKKDFVQSIMNMYSEWINLGESTQSHENISYAVRIIVDVIYAIILLIIFINVFNVNASSIFVPMTTILVSFSFAVGGVTSQFVISLVYVAYMFPYDIGDKISSPSINDGSTLIVKKINIMTSEFIESSSGKLIIASNHNMANYIINNYKRSSHVTFVEKIIITYDTPTIKINYLNDKIKKYLLDNPHEWKPNYEMCYNIIDMTNNKIELDFWLYHQASWSQGGIIYISKTKFEQYMIDILRQLDICHNTSTLSKIEKTQ